MNTQNSAGAMSGTREKVDCPAPGCKMSQVEGGIDVRGLKAHLMSKHGYDPAQASHAWEQATGRKSRGRPAKKRPIEYVDRDNVQPAKVNWLIYGVELANSLTPGAVVEPSSDYPLPTTDAQRKEFLRGFEAFFKQENRK